MFQRGIPRIYVEKSKIEIDHLTCIYSLFQVPSAITSFGKLLPAASRTASPTFASTASGITNSPI
jgi:hypothetical protein